MLQEKVKRSFDKVTMSQGCEEKIEGAILNRGRISSRRKIYNYIPKPAIACALVIGLLIATEGSVYAYTGSGIISHFISFAQNAVFTKGVEENGSGYASASFNTSQALAPAEYIDGSLIFTANGEQQDITDKVSQTKAFTYTYIDEEKVTHYLIVGGLPETFGYAEFMKDADEAWIGGYFQGGVVGEDINPAWLENAKNELNIPW